MRTLNTEFQPNNLVEINGSRYYIFTYGFTSKKNYFRFLGIAVDGGMEFATFTFKSISTFKVGDVTLKNQFEHEAVQRAIIRANDTFIKNQIFQNEVSEFIQTLKKAFDSI